MQQRQEALEQAERYLVDNHAGDQNEKPRKAGWNEKQYMCTIYT